MDHREYASDNRWWDSIDTQRLTARVTFDRYDEEIDDSVEETRTVRVRMEVCSTCDGRGQYVNPSIDSHGISREEFDEDPEFAEQYWGYRSGMYDVTCGECRGQKVVPVCLDDEVNDCLEAAAQARADMRAEYEAERRAGA